MVGIANVEAEFLVSFCTLARDMYPDLDWNAVEPKLERSWQRLRGDGGLPWRDVRDCAHARWTRSQ